MAQSQPEILSNIQARKDAEVVIELCTDRGDGLQPTPHFWRCLAELAAERAGGCYVAQGVPAVAAPAGNEPFTEDEAHRFERFTTLHFGKYRGLKILDVIAVDPTYIEWIADNAQNSLLRVNAQRYVNSKRFRDMRG